MSVSSVSSSAASVPSVAVSTRLLWIDFLRGLAVLGMIEAHAVNSFLDPLYRSGPWFSWLSYINGWVAPTFLFIAGLLQGAALRKNWENPRPPLARLKSLGVILLIGYGLQFPWNALGHLATGGGAEIVRALGRVDVLHCLAVSLAGLLLLAGSLKRWPTYEKVVAFLAGSVLLVGPFVWAALAKTTLDTPLFGYLSPAHGALFPLVPWFAFVAAGTLASRWIERPGVLGLAAFAAAAAGWMLKTLLHAWLEGQTYATRYDAFLFRLSLVLLGCAACAWLFRLRPEPGIVGKGILWAGSHSLGLYVWHLVLLHSGLGFVPALRAVYPRTQLPETVFWLYLLTLGGTLFLTWLWQWATKVFRRQTQPS